MFIENLEACYRRETELFNIMWIQEKIHWKLELNKIYFIFTLKALTVKQCSKIRDNFKAIACLTIPYVAMN